MFMQTEKQVSEVLWVEQGFEFVKIYSLILKIPMVCFYTGKGSKQNMKGRRGKDSGSRKAERGENQKHGKNILCLG